MKVKFFSDYEQSENLLRRFKANYDVYDDSIEFTIADDYDFAVAFNRLDEPLRPGAKLITVVQEPSFAESFQSRSSLVNSDYLLIHDPELFSRYWKVNLGGKVIESPSFMFYHDRVEHSFYVGSEDVKKDKKLSIIVSSHQFPWGNYHKRLNLLSKILKSDLDIDIYGRGLHIPDDRFKGELEYKHAGLLPYEYSIAIENTNEKNYITEKFVDCVLCNTVPIYNGAPNIAQVYDERYFKKLDLDSPDIINTLKEIISEPGPGTIVNKEIYQNKFNLFSKLKEIIFEIDSGLSLDL